ncbi:MAG: SDR family NAD(P)-dependent oxidoreductase [candidate division Zixibacteria bacterium]|nr:SDR family NAD(P)-dependent oxidoreductase [candidate division Zixibacteria bacterium]
MISMKDKIVLITGASAGIGYDTAVVFAREGAKLILTARRDQILKKLAEKLTKQYNTESVCFPLDVRSQQEVEQKLNALPAAWKKIDVLVNNAGLSLGMNKLHEGELIDWEEMIDTNVKGLLYVSRTVIPWMVKRNKGHVINISSIAGHEVYPGGNVYCATKHAVDALTKGMQMDLVDTPVRVSSVDPGMVETEFSIVRFRGDKNRAKTVYQGLKPLTGEDVAEAILFCATRPPHVNVSQLRIVPKDQASAMVANRK